MKFGTFFNQIEAGVSAGEARSVEAAIALLAEQGLGFVDMASSYFDEGFDIPGLLATLKQNGVSVDSMFHAFMFDPTSAEQLRATKDDTMRHLEQCAVLGSKVYMPLPIVPGHMKDELDRNNTLLVYTDLFADIAEKAKAMGIYAAVESYSEGWTPLNLISDFDYYFKNIPDLHFVLDTGNFWFTGTSSEEACELFTDRIVHVHLKDILPTADGPMNINGRTCDSVVIGQGCIDFPRIFTHLKKSGYNAGMTVEINNPHEPIRKIGESLAYLKATV